MRLTLFSGSVPARPATSCILYFFPFCKCFLHYILQSLQRLPESTKGFDLFHPAYKCFLRLCRVLVLHINCIISSCFLYVNTLLYKLCSVFTYFIIKTVSADLCVVFRIPALSNAVFTALPGCTNTYVSSHHPIAVIRNISTCRLQSTGGNIFIRTNSNLPADFKPPDQLPGKQSCPAATPPHFDKVMPDN